MTSNTTNLGASSPLPEGGKSLRIPIEGSPEGRSRAVRRRSCQTLGATNPRQNSAMTAELLIACIASLLAGGLITWLVLRRSIHAADESLKQYKGMVRDLEAQVHERQHEAAIERNRLELEHQERMKAIRADASEEGRQLGLAEAKHDRITELTAQQASFCRATRG